MGSTVSTPWEYANQLLEIAQAAVDTTIGGPIPGPKGRALVSPGLPTIDCCPWLSVHVSGFSVAPTLPQGPVASGVKSIAGTLPIVHFTLLVARCLPPLGPKGEFPPVAAIELAARAVDEDMWAITDAVRKADYEQILFAGACMEVWHDGATPIDPAGGCGGWTIRYRAAVQGITPA